MTDTVTCFSSYDYSALDTTHLFSFPSTMSLFSCKKRVKSIMSSVIDDG